MTWCHRRGSLTWQNFQSPPNYPAFYDHLPRPKTICGETLGFHLFFFNEEDDETYYSLAGAPPTAADPAVSAGKLREEMKGGKAKEKKAGNKLSVKKAVKKAAKDPNKPKRPPSAFFVFMEEFRKQFKEKNPHNKSVAVVGKAGGDKWKSMSESEKAPYISKAEKRKADYNKSMAAYNKGETGRSHEAEEEDESDKSKSEVHDDDEESGEEEDDE